jgi:hypothetical protein
MTAMRSVAAVAMLVSSLGASWCPPALAQDDLPEARVGLLFSDQRAAPSAAETSLARTTQQAATLARHRDAAAAGWAIERAQRALREARQELEAGRSVAFQRSVEIAAAALALASRQIAARGAERVRAHAERRAALAEAELQRARAELASVKARCAAELDGGD